jgi:hypothetical protein
MKAIARAALQVLYLLVPAACGTTTYEPAYGVPVRFVRGRVVARATQAPIPGIKVQCLDSSGTALPSVTSDDNGRFEIQEYPCPKVLADDVDGASNGGPYAPATVEVTAENESDVLVEMGE